MANNAQLAFAFSTSPAFGEESFFVSDCNREAHAWVRRWPQWMGYGLIVSGPEGSGKTHLATIWAATSGARVISAHALSETALRPALATGALVVEDAAVASDEHALFHLINMARQEGAYLLFTARLAPSAWPVTIPDVNSRLRAMPVATLQPPDDAMLRAVIVKLAADRQLGIDESVVRYLSTRIERSFAAARAAVIALDQEALRQGRPLTRALAAEMFRDMV